MTTLRRVAPTCLCAMASGLGIGFLAYLAGASGPASMFAASFSAAGIAACFLRPL